MTQTDEPQTTHKFSGLAWSSLILGIVGIVGSPLLIFNNLTAIAAGVGVVLGAIALAGTRQVLAGVGVLLSVAAIVFTVMAQQSAVEQINEDMNQIEQEFQQDMDELDRQLENDLGGN